MSKADYPYPDDEFDAPPDPTAPRGVHRAPRSAWSRWMPFVLVLVLAPLLAFGIVTYVTRGGDLPLGGGSGDGDKPAASAPATTGTDEDAPDDGDGDGDAEPTEPTQEEPTQDETTAAAPDFATPVTVYNAAGIQGLAATASQRLTSAGFTKVSPENFTGTKPASSTVFYATEEDRVTADIIASALGLGTVQLDAAQAGSGIVVVLVSALS